MVPDEHSNNHAMAGIHGIININKYVDMDTGRMYYDGRGERNMNEKYVTVRIQGDIVGPIWWPSGEECYKSFDRTFHRGNFGNISRGHEVNSLEEMLDKLTNDGDFQNCRIGNAILTVSYHRGSREVSRVWELRGISYPDYFSRDYPVFPPMEG
jgi:hypothetical protein